MTCFIYVSNLFFKSWPTVTVVGTLRIITNLMFVFITIIRTIVCTFINIYIKLVHNDHGSTQTFNIKITHTTFTITLTVTWIIYVSNLFFKSWLTATVVGALRIITNLMFVFITIIQTIVCTFINIYIKLMHNDHGSTQTFNIKITRIATIYPKK